MFVKSNGGGIILSAFCAFTEAKDLAVCDCKSITEQRQLAK